MVILTGCHIMWTSAELGMSKDGSQMNSQWESCFDNSSGNHPGGGGRGWVIEYYHRTLQCLSELNSLRQTTLWHIAHGNSTQTPGEHYWLCRELPMPEVTGFLFEADSNHGNLHLGEAMKWCTESNFSGCQRWGSNHQPLDNKVIALSIPPWGLL